MKYSYLPRPHCRLQRSAPGTAPVPTSVRGAPQHRGRSRDRHGCIVATAKIVLQHVTARHLVLLSRALCDLGPPADQHVDWATPRRLEACWGPRRRSRVQQGVWILPHGPGARHPQSHYTLEERPKKGNFDTDKTSMMSLILQPGAARSESSPTCTVRAPSPQAVAVRLILARRSAWSISPTWLTWRHPSTRIAGCNVTGVTISSRQADHCREMGRSVVLGNIEATATKAAAAGQHGTAVLLESLTHIRDTAAVAPVPGPTARAAGQHSASRRGPR